jgi:hypothetical protein
VSDQEVKELIAAYGFTGSDADKAYRLCQEVERTTRQAYFALMQNANNAACSRSITARDLDRLVWDTEQARKVKP